MAGFPTFPSNSSIHLTAFLLESGNTGKQVLEVGLGNLEGSGERCDQIGEMRRATRIRVITKIRAMRPSLGDLPAWRQIFGMFKGR
jgi:hypothetical protein